MRAKLKKYSRDINSETFRIDQRENSKSFIQRVMQNESKPRRGKQQRKKCLNESGGISQGYIVRSKQSSMQIRSSPTKANRDNL